LLTPHYNRIPRWFSTFLLIYAQNSGTNTPESASLSIKTNEINEDISDIIRIGTGSGWLMVRIEKDRTWIGLHPILSPMFQISFRYPFYYPEPISDINILKGFLLGTDSESLKFHKLILKNREDRYKKKRRTSISKAVMINQHEQLSIEIKG